MQAPLLCSFLILPSSVFSPLADRSSFHQRPHVFLHICCANLSLPSIKAPQRFLPSIDNSNLPFYRISVHLLGPIIASHSSALLLFGAFVEAHHSRHGAAAPFYFPFSISPPFYHISVRLYSHHCLPLRHCSTLLLPSTVRIPLSFQSYSVASVEAHHCFLSIAAPQRLFISLDGSIIPPQRLFPSHVNSNLPSLLPYFGASVEAHHRLPLLCRSACVC